MAIDSYKMCITYICQKIYTFSNILEKRNFIEYIDK